MKRRREERQKVNRAVKVERSENEPYRFGKCTAPSLV